MRTDVCTEFRWSTLFREGRENKWSITISQASKPRSLPFLPTQLIIQSFNVLWTQCSLTAEPWYLLLQLKQSMVLTDIMTDCNADGCPSIITMLVFRVKNFVFSYFSCCNYSDFKMRACVRLFFQYAEFVVVSAAACAGLLATSILI